MSFTLSDFLTKKLGKIVSLKLLVIGDPLSCYIKLSMYKGLKVFRRTRPWLLAPAAFDL